MGLFSKAVNEQGYLKAGFMGFPGSGKSYTATDLAIGLVKKLGDTRPVFALDTEKGFDYLTQKFDKAGVELQIARTRAFVDLIAAIDEAEKSGSVLIIDSITHFWEEVQESYKKKMQRTRLQFQDWGPIKSSWKKYTERYLNSKLHIVMCGRAGDTYDYFEDEDGKKQLHKTGTKMQAEKNLGYEPGLGIEMERVGVGELKAGQRNFVNRAYVLKDRFDVLDGRYFDNPTFETFLPHIELLNIGVHGAISGNDSTELFDKNSDKNWMEKHKQVEILKEEIEGILVSAYPNRGANDVKTKTDLVHEAYGTHSWKALDDLSPDTLRKGIEVIKSKIASLKAEPVTNGTKKHTKAEV